MGVRECVYQVVSQSTTYPATARLGAVDANLRHVDVVVVDDEAM